MTAGDFEHGKRERWEAFERLVGQLERGEGSSEAVEFPRRFREVCMDLMLAEQRMYGARLVERLNALVIRGHEVLHRRKAFGFDRLRRFVAVDFPVEVRREWRLFWVCNAVFWVPFLVMLAGHGHDIRWIQAVLGPGDMMAMEQMYGGREQQVTHLRAEHGSNFMMFCYYIYNNVSIDFRIFAGGMAAGVGSLFFLLFNGVHLGAAAGYVHYACDPEAFWSFVSGHSSFELAGMVVSGMAGMRLGLALLNPGRLPRVRALVVAGRRALPLIYGAALLTLVAALIEGFWSAQPLPSGLKYGFGVAGWILLGLYFLVAGRRVGDEA